MRLSLKHGAGVAIVTIATFCVPCDASTRIITPFEGERVLYAPPAGSSGLTVEIYVDRAGNLFGTQPDGGAYNRGAAFELVPSGRTYAKRIIYSFGKQEDARYPYAGLVADAHGALYGTASYGGHYGYGAVYVLTPAGRGGYAESILYRFRGGKDDGAYPFAPLITDRSGALYGTTSAGGGIGCGTSSYPGCGTVFKLIPAPNGYTERILHRFRRFDGGESPYTGLAADASGALYGSTAYGGAGYGVVFKLTPVQNGTYVERVLRKFGNSDGQMDNAGPIVGQDGALYGTTVTGGRYGGGTLYRMQTGGYADGWTVLHDFGAQGDGSEPEARLLEGPDGTLYGTCYGGGTNRGTLFRLLPKAHGYTYNTFYDFRGIPDGSRPEAGLTIDATGVLYGTTAQGGGGNAGTVFRIDPV